MPELPEVETIRRQLAKRVVGKKIGGIEVREEKSWIGNSELLNGKTIVSLGRVGKYLYIHTDDKTGLGIHLKMTGRLVWGKTDYETAKHTRVIITLENAKLYFWDTRKFGYIRYFGNSREEEERQKKKLGPDPWEMTEEQFYKICQKYKRPIKNLILDQATMAGVGNIYANDGLWEAGVDPRRESRSMNHEVCRKLLLSLRKVMERGLLTGGASDNSYVDALGNKGKYQDEFRVYRRTNQPCLRCGQKILRIVVGGRGSWYCSNCQS